MSRVSYYKKSLISLFKLQYLGFVSVGLLIIFSTTRVEGVTRWIGGTSSNWHNTDNWDNGIPTSSDTARIQDNTPYPIIQSDDAVCKRLVINAGASLNLTGGCKLTVGTENVETIVIGGILTFDEIGDTIITSGRVTVQDGATLNISDGYFDINGTNPVIGEDHTVLESTCNFNMSGGVFDCRGYLEIQQINENVTGGTIFCAGIGFADQVDGFIPSGGTIIAVGSLEERGIDFFDTLSVVYNIQIGDGVNPCTNWVWTADSSAHKYELDVLGNLTVAENAVFYDFTNDDDFGTTVHHTLDVEGNILINGRLELEDPQNYIWCGGDWTDNGTFIHGNSTVYFDGSGSDNQTIGSGSETFYNLTVDKAGEDPGDLKPESDLIIEKNLRINSGTLEMATGSSLKLTDSLIVNSGGTIRLVGTSIDSVTITHNGTGSYAFTVNSGGTIDAKYYKFEYMDVNGINIRSGATITKYPVIGGEPGDSCGLSYGSFAHGASGGTMLTIDNNQGDPDTLFLERVSFDTLWSEGVAHNVTKNISQGLVCFTGGPFYGLGGNFWGEDWDDDVYNRISWEQRPLGVELAWFEAIGQYESVLLQWMTESEPDNAGWLLARSKEAGFKSSRCQDKFKLQNVNWKVKNESPTRQMAGRQKLKTSDADLRRDKLPTSHFSLPTSDNWQIIAEVQAEGEGHIYNWVDSLVEAENTYWYKLGSIDNNSDTTWYDDYIDSATPRAYRVVKFDLKQSWPNPFAEHTTIKYAVPGKLPSANKPNVSLKIYDISGRLVNTIINEKVAPGSYTVNWDGKSNYGKSLPAGTYFCRLEVGRYKQAKKLILLK
ncbi:T9SS type A sorting domain-containing protein [candidate division WOR-3 bacterium]|nr:T9SS type A sorting domain-containing protein [candidate division WOR-3 bacterium]